MFRKLMLLSFLLSCWHQLFAQQNDPAYALMLKGLYKNSVPVISPSALQQELVINPAAYILLDTRAPDEFKVSHLPSARFLHYNKIKDQDLLTLPKDKTLVVYCSVGYRSERIGERLLALGYPKVYNLYGGIFQWVNEGQPIVNSQGVSTNKVHAYSRSWGIWIKKGEKVYE